MTSFLRYLLTELCRFLVCKVYLSLQNGLWCLPRVWHNGLPLDLGVHTRFRAFLARILPSRIARQLQSAASARLDHALYGLQPNCGITGGGVIVVNDELPGRILSGRVQVRPLIERLTPSGVRFTDGTRVDDVAAVVCATGR